MVSFLYPISYLLSPARQRPSRRPDELKAVKTPPDRPLSPFCWGAPEMQSATNQLWKKVEKKNQKYKSGTLGDVGGMVVAGVAVQNIKGAEVGVKPGILDGKDVGVFTRFIVVGVPVSRGGDEGGARFPVFPVAVLDHAVGIEFGSDHGVAARLAANDKVESDRFVPVGILDFSLGQEPEHGPQGVRDGAGLGEVGVGKKNADAVGLTGHGVARNLLKFGGGFRVFEHGGMKAFFRGGDTEIAEQGCIVDPVEAGFALGVMDSFPVGGENHEVALFPFDGPAAGFRAPRALKDEEQLAGGKGVGFEGAFDNPDEIGEEGGAGGGTGTF